MKPDSSCVFETRRILLPVIGSMRTNAEHGQIKSEKRESVALLRYLRPNWNWIVVPSFNVITYT